MDPTRFVSSLRENRAQYIALLARAARLTAVASGKAFVPPPELIKEAPDLVEQERSAYESKRMELDATVGVASQQYAMPSISSSPSVGWVDRTCDCDAATICTRCPALTHSRAR